MRIQASDLGVQSYPPFTVHLRAPGVSSLRGLGTTDLVGIVSSYANSFMNGINSGVEQGNVATPDQVSQTLTSAVANACADQPPGTPCDPSSVASQISAAVAAYAAALALKQNSFAQEVAAGQVVIPGGSTYVQPGATVASAPQSTTGAPTSVQLVNSSRPGQSFRVGDNFAVTVHGSPGQPVSVSGTQNNVSKGTTPVGTTDATGNFTINGTMTPDTVGNWSETWIVGGAAAPALNYSVAAAPGGAAPSTSSSPSAGPAATSSSSTSTTLTTPSSSSSTSSTSNSTAANWLEQTAFTIPFIGTETGGYPVPWWEVLVGAGAVALWMYMSSRGKR